MKKIPELFNQKFINIDNAISEEAAESILYIKQAGYFTSENCPLLNRQRSDCLFFMLVISGKGIVEYDGKTHNVTKGQCVFINSEKPHNYMADSKDPWEVIWISFGGEASRFYYSKFTGKEFCIFIPMSFDYVQTIMIKIIINNINKLYEYEIINAKLITDLMTAIITNYCIYEEDNLNKVKNKIFYVRDYLDNNFTNSISLDHLSEKFFISKFYLTREFKKEFNTTIIQYTLAKRIEYAKELLTYTNKSIEEISVKCGFSDQSYFSRQFKKSENMTCLAYRKKAS